MDKIFDAFYRFCEKFIKNEKIMKLIRRLFSKEVILYLVFGVLTTVVNMVVFGALGKLDVNHHIANVTAWIAAVAFAFVTNKLFVFESKSMQPKVLLKEIATFSGARLLTLGIEEAGLFIMIDMLHLDEPLTTQLVGGKMIVKILLAVIVVVLNYVFSKVIIFKKK